MNPKLYQFLSALLPRLAWTALAFALAGGAVAIGVMAWR